MQKILVYEHSNIQICYFSKNGHNKSKLSSSIQFYGLHFVIYQYLGTFEIDFSQRLFLLFYPWHFSMQFAFKKMEKQGT